tara:strand:- start:16115 stop:16939 length:825 start_codon:yes stop_codon:yes gene_type:complete
MKNSYIKFWGVRGSSPTADKDKMLFGGDTSCVEIRTANNEIIIFDMGSGIRNLGKEIIQDSNSPKTINIFLSHFHFDHVMGFLVFPPLFDSSFTINIYGFNKSTSTKSFSDKILDSTFWPVGLDIMKAKINFIDLDGEPLQISEQTSISYALHPHPGYATSYKLDTNGYSIVYTTDCEHPKNHFNKNVENIAKDANILIHDSHFTRADLLDHKGWGHSSWETTVNLAKKINVDKAILYHYNPLYSDKKLSEIEDKAKKAFKNTIASKQGMKINF